MAGAHQKARPISPGELKALLAAERQGEPFLVYRRGDGSQLIFRLDGQRGRVTIGRAPDADLTLDGDDEISRVHAELEAIGSAWAVVDEGLSTNGTFLNGRRLSGRRRLVDGDLLRLGHTEVSFRDPQQEPLAATLRAGELPNVHDLSPTQRRVLTALCRPYKADPFATPATNQQIANELFLSVDAVKKHLRVLYRRYDLDDLQQNQKRAKLAELALQAGLVTHREL